MSEEEQKQKPKRGLQDGRQTPVYRALQRLCTRTQEFAPGAIVDLSHLPQESIRWFIDHKLIETADGVPENEPVAKADPCKNC